MTSPNEPVPDGTNGASRRRDPARVRLAKIAGWEIHDGPSWLVVVIVIGRLALRIIPLAVPIAAYALGYIPSR